MPPVRIVLFMETRDGVPVLRWLAGLPRRARAKVRVKIRRLAELGHELRRPEADYLGSGLYELCAREQNVNYRLLYFFHQRWTAVLAHGFEKQQGPVPLREMRLALARMEAFESAPALHTFQDEI